MKQVEELIHIAKSVEFDKLKVSALPLISQTRYLEKRGELLEVVRGGTLFSSRPRFSPIYLFLFNDLLLITNKKSGDRYVVVDHAHRSLVQVQSNKETSLGPGLDHCFYLTILENHQGKMMERLLKAPNQSVSPPTPTPTPSPNPTPTLTLIPTPNPTATPNITPTKPKCKSHPQPVSIHSNPNRNPNPKPNCNPKHNPNQSVSPPI
ncbi:UNVERIFIED_CONTAM: hypothetical protein FKN15_013884 [Acipenser sinensis]